MQLVGRKFQGFGRGGGSRRGGLESFQGPGRAGEFSQTWAGLEQLPTVYTCVSKIVGGVAALPASGVGLPGVTGEETSLG